MSFISEETATPLHKLILKVCD